MSKRRAPAVEARACKSRRHQVSFNLLPLAKASTPLLDPAGRIVDQMNGCGSGQEQAGRPRLE
eukprot:1140511-Pelagomonas_calceolata.AAC.9